LRAGLRQDPDVILVGEMRDLENDCHLRCWPRNRPPGLFHFAHPRRHGNDSAHHRGFSAARAEADSLQMAATLKAVISQRLVRRSDDKGASPPSKS